MRSHKRRPPPSSAAFTAGDAVEVTSVEEGFTGAWFEGRVLRPATHRHPYTVVYDHLVDDADETQLLMETVHPDLIRPRPPRFAKNGGFQIHQMVDAFHNDGWWVGVVVEVKEGGRYRVMFAVEECEYGEEELRIHLDWVDGDWLLPALMVPKVSEVPVKVPSPPAPELQRTQEVEFTKGTMVEVRGDEEFGGGWYTATILDSIGEKCVVEYEHLWPGGRSELLKKTVESVHIRPTPPATRADEKLKFLEAVDVLFNERWWEGVISKVLSSGYLVRLKATKEEMAFGHQELRLHYDWIDGTWLRASQAVP